VQRPSSKQLSISSLILRRNRADTINVVKREGLSESPEAGNASVNRSNNKVLIVEDNIQTAHSLAEMIEYLDVECEIAADGCEATKLLEENQYFLVIADTHVPKVSGCELLKHIKSKYPSMPVAVISTSDTTSTRGMVVKNRADFYLPKPIKMSDVKELVTIAAELRDR
jgi:DNA-binding response OmpR family regulator